MKLHEQRDGLKTALDVTENRIHGLVASINRKMSMPYGDGERSNMVNAETDVLPELRSILDSLRELEI